MPSSDNDISSSGKVAAQNIRVSDKFTDFAELPSKGHCRLMKAQRYGIWNVLKGLKPEYTADKQFAQMLTKEYTLMVGLWRISYGKTQLPCNADKLHKNF